MILDLNLRTIYRFILVVLFLVIFVSFSRHIHYSDPNLMLWILVALWWMVIPLIFHLGTGFV